jgi:hypothetical protein
LGALFLVIYFYPLTAKDTASVWFSNWRCVTYDGDDAVGLKFANITIDNQGLTQFRDDGIIDNVYVGNLTGISLADGIVIWANDSLNAYNFPLVSLDYTHSDRLYANALSVTAILSYEGVNYTIPKTNFNHMQELTQLDVNFSELEAQIHPTGNTSYTLSISIEVYFEASFSSPPFLSTSPSKIASQEVVDLGNISITCINGQRSYAQINFPYVRFSYPISIPFIQALLR